MRNLRDEARWIIGEIDEAKRLAKAVGKPQLGTSSIEAGRVEEYDQDGALVQIIGEQYDGTHAPVTVNGPTPPEPAGLSITVGVGSVEARWNGKFSGGAVSPMDFSHVSLHGSRPEVFTPSNETQLATIAGELGDVATVILEPGEWTFGLVAVSKAGKWSELSETVTVEIPDYPAPVDIQDELILLDEKYEGVITEAGSLGGRLDQAEQELTAHEGRLEQAETDVNTALSGDVDIDRLAIGNGVIRDLVAQHIAGKTAAFQQVDVKNLFVTTGTMTEAVINKLFTDVVMSRKITAEMLAIGSFDNLFSEPDFKEGGSSWGIWGSNTVGMFGREGTSALRLIGTGGDVAVYNQPLRRPVAPSSSYRGVAWVRASANVPASSFRLIGVVYSASGEISYSWVSAPALVEGEWTFISGAMDISSKAATASFGVTVRSNFPSGVTLDVDFVSLTRMSAGELVVDGSIKARHADLEDFAANTGFIADLTAKIVKSEMFVGKEFFGGTFVGSNFWTSPLDGVGMKLDNDGLRAYGPEGGEPVAEIRPDGGTVYQVSDPVTGEVLGGIDSGGGLTGTSLAVSGEARMDGAVVTGGDPISGGHGSGTYGVTMNGRDMLGATFMNYVEQHPNVADGNAWLTVIPHGVVAHQEVSTPNQGWNATGGIDHCRIRAVVTLNAVYGRMYQITYRTPAIRETSNVGGTIGGAHLVYSAPNGSIAAGASGNRSLTGSRYYLRGGDGFDQAMVTTYARCPEDIPEGKIMLGPEVYIYSGRAAEATDVNATARWSVVVADLGMRRSSYTGRDIDSNKQGTAPPPAPTPDPDPVKRYVETVDASWWQAYAGNNSQATHSTYAGAAAQGRTPYAPGNGIMRGLVGFPSQASRLSGATVKKIEVYVYAKSWHASAGGTAVLGVHGHGSKPSTWSSTTDNVTYQKMKRPEGRWITLPSSVHAGFKSGALRGVSFLPPNGSTSTEYYGIFTGNKTRLRVTYEK